MKELIRILNSDSGSGLADPIGSEPRNRKHEKWVGREGSKGH
jgi:hypothetical protein